MSFLAPLFLLGALAVALPVIFHLIRRTTRERTVFSSLMFLWPTPPRLTRRSRLEHILLLLLRCAVLCLLAFGFARPFIKTATPGDPSSGPGKRVVVLLDTSASMRRGNVWPEARSQAEAMVRKAAPADQVAVFTFGQPVTRLVTFDQWNATPAGERAALVARRLAEVSPAWSATHLGNALVSAAEALEDPDSPSFLGRRQIVLISDLQEGSRLGPLQAYEWPKNVELILGPVKARRPTNAGLQLVADADEADKRPADSGLRVRVSNASDSKREQFQVGWARPEGKGFVGTATDVYVPPGQSRVVPAPAPPTNASVDRLVLQGDDEDFDNAVFVVPPETARANVLYWGRDSEKDTKQPLYFLQRAFQQTRRQTVQVIARGPNAPLLPTEGESAALIVVTDPLPEPQVNGLRRLLSGGQTILFVMKSPESAPTLAALLEVNRLAVEEARTGGYAMLGEIDFRHPLFAPFADPRFSDFTKIHFWKYRRLDAAAIPGARLLAKFDSGDAAFLEVPVGKGRLLVLTSGWHPDDSQLALSSKFVPLLYSILEQTGGVAPAPAQYFVGDTVPLRSLTGPTNLTLTVRTPDGRPVQLAQGETNFSQTLAPGIYTVTSAQPPQRFAVNLEAAESRTAPLPADELERLGAPVRHLAPDGVNPPGRPTRLQNAELENRQKLWRWLIVAAMVVLLAESWLAGWLARRSTTQTEATL